MSTSETPEEVEAVVQSPEPLQEVEETVRMTEMMAEETAPLEPEAVKPIIDFGEEERMEVRQWGQSAAPPSQPEEER